MSYFLICVIRENEIFLSVNRDSLYFRFVNRARDPPCTTLCKRSFTQLSTCKRHERIQAGVQPYTCNRCKKCSSHVQNCKKHERIHTGVKPYSCKHCEKCFNHSSTYKQHEQTHTGVKPYTPFVSHLGTTRNHLH